MMIDSKDFLEKVYSDVFSGLQNKMEVLNATPGVSAKIENGVIAIHFDEDIADDKEQDKVKVFLKGGAIMKQSGAEKIKNGKQVTLEDFYVFNPMGDTM